MRICVVIPFYNEKSHISSVVNQILKERLDIVLVDDGSSDAYVDVGLINKRVVLLKHKINIGKGAAMKTGAEYAFSHGYNAVIFVDGDGQHSAGDIQKFIKALSDGKNDVVFGSRNLNMGVPLVRFLGNKFASLLISILFGIYVTDSLCGFRAVTRRAYEKINWSSSGYGVETEMVIRTARAGLRFVEVPVETKYINNVKGVTLLDAFGIFAEVIKWWLSK